MIVVDASVALQWFLRDEANEAALGLLASGEELIAPQLVVAEVANGLWKAARVGRAAEAQLELAIAELSGCFTELVDLSRLLPRALSLARTLDHPAYDGFYLALAEARHATLVTADERLL